MDKFINKNFKYTGVGSRETPKNILKRFKEIGQFLSYNDFTLRSGHAKGADQAFELGCDIFYGDKEIYLPWYKFEGSNSNLFNINDNAYQMIQKYHPNYNKLNIGAKKLLARDCYQILGFNLNSPSSFVVCYTENGKTIGGTAIVIKIANDYNIPIFNYGIKGTD